MLVTLVVLLVVGGHFLQRSMLFYPTHDRRESALTHWKSAGEQIGYAREVANPVNVWLLLHGNGGQASDRSYALAAFSARDSVFILEYPGYGQRSGSPSRRAFDRAAGDAYAALRARFPSAPVCVAAESIGSGPGSILARQSRPPDKFVFVVPFDRLKAVGRRHVPAVLAELLLLGSWDNVQALAGYRGPVEIYGAQRDEVIPVSHAKSLADALPQAQFHLIPGGHNDWAQQGEVRFRNP
jgi:pimeloyl-ACP methyl ester carboxylesterase